MVIIRHVTGVPVCHILHLFIIGVPVTGNNQLCCGAALPSKQLSQGRPVIGAGLPCQRGEDSVHVVPLTAAGCRPAAHGRSRRHVRPRAADNGSQPTTDVPAAAAGWGAAAADRSLTTRPRRTALTRYTASVTLHSFIHSFMYSFSRIAIAFRPRFHVPTTLAVVTTSVVIHSFLVHSSFLK